MLKNNVARFLPKSLNPDPGSQPSEKLGLVISYRSLARWLRQFRSVAWAGVDSFAIAQSVAGYPAPMNLGLGDSFDPKICGQIAPGDGASNE